MKKTILIVSLFSLTVAAKAQQNNATRPLITRQSYGQYLTAISKLREHKQLLKYRGNYYRIDSVGLKTLQFTWIDSTYFMSPAALPPKLRSLNELVLVMHLNDRSHPNAFDSLRHHLTPIKIVKN